MTLMIAIVKFVAISVTVTLAAALILIVTQNPGRKASGRSLNFSSVAGPGSDPEPLQTHRARNGSPLGCRHYPAAQGAPLLVLVHGSGWHGAQFDTLARALASSGAATVLVPDMRGHGPDPERRGDVDYIGQIEDDIADLIIAKRGDSQQVLLGGFSTGGAVVARFAGGQHRDLIDGAIMMAPFLSYKAPTTRANSGGWAQALVRRIIGLSVLNAFRIRALNHLTVLSFSFPEAVLSGPDGHTATTSYSYRMNASTSTRFNYLDDVKALPRFLLVAGTDDDAFFPEGFQPLMKKVNNKGTYRMIGGADHIGLSLHPELPAVISAFLAEFRDQP